jgi:SMC interacting uncharacterized protein involved in chromosome segregation
MRVRILWHTLLSLGPNRCTTEHPVSSPASNTCRTHRVELRGHIAVAVGTMDSEALAVTRMVAEMEHEVEQLAKKAAQVEAKLDKANADIEHRKVDLLRLQSEAGSDDRNARQQCETKTAIEREEMERAIMHEQRNARYCARCRCSRAQASGNLVRTATSEG